MTSSFFVDREGDRCAAHLFTLVARANDLENVANGRRMAYVVAMLLSSFRFNYSADLP